MTNLSVAIVPYNALPQWLEQNFAAQSMWMRYILDTITILPARINVLTGEVVEYRVLYLNDRTE